MSKRNISKSYREAMVRVLGTKCRNCGSDENIEYHHVVPLKSTKIFGPNTERNVHGELVIDEVHKINRYTIEVVE